MSPERLWTLVADRPALLPGTRLVCVDGPAGSGKTTLATGLVEAAAAAGVTGTLVHMDDLYAGWTGLDEGVTQARSLVDALVRGEPASYARFDWHAGEYAERHAVPPTELVVLEGVGAADPAYARLTTLSIWVEAAADVRLRRGLARDGETMRDHWCRWMADEAHHHSVWSTRDRADLLLDGVTGRAVVSQVMPRSQH